MPRRRAVAFIFAVNASWLPASRRASIQAMLPADGSSSASGAWRSEMACPAARADPDFPGGQPAGLHVLPSEWGKGIGGGLHDAALAVLSEAGYRDEGKRIQRGQRWSVLFRRVAVRPVAGVHRRDEGPLYPAGEVVVGHRGDLIQDALLVAGGQAADPDHRCVEGS